MPHDAGREGRAEHEGRHDQCPQVLRQAFGRADIAGGRQYAELDRKQQDQQHPEPEIRHRQTAQRRYRHAVIDRRARPDGGQNPGRNADCQREQQRQPGQLGGDRQFFGDQVENRTLDADRLAEIGAQHPFKPQRIAHRQRPIEIIGGSDVGDDRRVLVFAGQDQRGIAGQQLLHRKDQHRYQQHGRPDRRDPAQQPSSHKAVSPGESPLVDAQPLRPNQPVGVWGEPGELVARRIQNFRCHR